MTRAGRGAPPLSRLNAITRMIARRCARGACRRRRRVERYGGQVI